ncbi:AbrB family transcriptional regulator [Bifidobacterium simiarum]|uniref:AbrB family transcriptional regulator n=1 Tax=Bifidobacterium simiarum TaxID=2045441 RepID=UPI001BDD07D6|nr:AbrB family transcriptional regulator [Bifidobacterium simiarum]
MTETSQPEQTPAEQTQTEQTMTDQAAADQSQSDQTATPAAPDEAHETLTASYERLRHSVDPEELGEFARRPLPDPSDAAAFSRATALLEAVAGNLHTAVADRLYLAEHMPFPNILVKLSVDPEMAVRKAVAQNTDDKNWLVGRLTKDDELEVRAAALVNPRTSWKMRMEGAQDERNDPETLDYLSRFGVSEDQPGPAVLTAMIRRAVALNPSASEETIERLSQDADIQVRHAVEKRRASAA